MKNVMYLDRYDIARIIAKHFNVDPKEVDVHPYIDTEGVGPNEHQVANIEIIIATGMKFNPDKWGCEEKDA